VTAIAITPREFLEDIFRDTEYNVNLRAIDRSGKLPVKETFIRGADEIIKWAEEHRTSYDCYFGVATRNGSGKKEAIRELVVVHVDVDFKTTPQEKADKLQIGFPLPPTYKIASGGGYHLYWLLEEPAERENINRIEAINRGLAKVLGGDLASCDASRILRIPGTPNRKPDYGRPSPIVAIVGGQPGKRYTLSAFDDYAEFPEAPTPASSVGDKIPAGERNATLTSMAGTMRRRGFTESTIEAALLAENRAKCSPPLPDAEVRGIVQSVTRYSPIKTFNLTDLGNAKRLVAQYRDRIRYCRTWKTWMVHDGTRWSRDDTGQVHRYAKQVTRDIYHEAGDDASDGRRKELSKHAMKTEGENRIEAMISLAKTEEGIAIRPADMDRHPLKLNVLNGTLNLAEGKLYPHDPADLITQLAPVSFDEEAPFSLLMKFLSDIFPGKEELVRFVHRFFGYCATGSTKEQVFVIGHGEGSNGKTVLLETVSAVLGDYAQPAPFSTFTMKRSDNTRNDLAGLHNSRLVTSSESTEGRRFDEELLKRLTGDEKVTARFLYGEFFDYMPKFKLFLASNHLPKIKGTDYAMWRRVRLVPFEAVFTDEKGNRDRDIKGKLLAEASGILNWIVSGAMVWSDIGLGEAEEIKAATGKYREGEDMLGNFLAECCEHNPELEQPARDLFLAYKEYCGGRAGNEKDFSQAMRRRGYGTHRKKKGTYWTGLTLVADRREET